MITEEEAIRQSGELGHAMIEAFMKSLLDVGPDVIEKYLMQVIHSSLATAISIIVHRIGKAFDFPKEVLEKFHDDMIGGICAAAIKSFKVTYDLESTATH